MPREETYADQQGWYGIVEFNVPLYHNIPAGLHTFLGVTDSVFSHKELNGLSSNSLHSHIILMWSRSRTPRSWYRFMTVRPHAHPCCRVTC